MAEAQPLDAVLDDVFAQGMVMIKETSGWTYVSNESSTLLESKPFSGSPINTLRATTLLDASPEAAANLHWNLTEKDYKDMSPVGSGPIEDIETLSSGARVRVFKSCLSWPVWSRKTVYVEKKFHDDSGFWHVSCTISHPKAVVDKSKYVEVSLIIGLWGWTKEGDKTRMWRLLQANPNGSLPSFLVNSGSDGPAQHCRWFRKNCK